MSQLTLRSSQLKALILSIGVGLVVFITVLWLGGSIAFEQESLQEHAAKHTDPNYVCPMHPNIVKGEPSSCPICGMDLVLKKQDTLQEHANKHSDPSYICPMHPKIVKGEPDNCPICGMDLVLTELSTTKNGLPIVSISDQIAKKMSLMIDKVTSKVISRQVFVTLGTVTIVKEKSIWVYAEVNALQFKSVVEGDLAQMVIKGKPNQTWYGDVAKRQNRNDNYAIRLRFDKSKNVITEDTAALITVNTKTILLTIPANALIYYESEQHVVKSLGDNQYQPVIIKTGAQRDGRISVIEGLEADDRIVTSGQFLIDAESSLKGNF